jgi:carbon-monoxide dehydrogenase medium subunit
MSVPAGRGDGFAAVTIGKDGTCIVNAAASVDGGAPRIAIGCVAAVPVVLKTDSAEAGAVREAVRSARLQPPSDVHASAEYRRRLAEVLAVRAVQMAEQRRN